jgi:uncharacterized protein (DUF433 family)
MIAKPEVALGAWDAQTAAAHEAAERLRLCTPNRHWQDVAEKQPGVESDPRIYDGRPVVRGTRIPVSVVIGYLTLGPGREQLLRDYPDLDAGKIKDAVDFALGLLEG